jgi:MFS family permease
MTERLTEDAVAPPEIAQASVSLSGYVRLLRRNRNLRRLWSAQIVSELGDWFYTLAIYTLLLQFTGRASSVALALMLQVLPMTLMGPTAGVVNDRISRKKVMITADLVRMVVVFCMLFVRSRSTIWLVYPLLLLETVMVAFFEPARNAVIPNITTRDEVVLANTLSSTTWSMNLVLGAALGGVVAALLGRDAVFILNAVSFLVSALFIRGMKFDEPHTDHAAPLRVHDLGDYSMMREGFRYVRQHPRLRSQVFVKAGLFVIGPGWVLFTVMGERYFRVTWHGIDAQRGAMLGMSLLMGARGLGALLGPLFAAPWAGRRESRLRFAILIGFIAEALGYVGFGAAGSVWVACAWIVLAHSGGSSVWVFSTTLLQLNTEDRFRGRVFAADNGLSMLTIGIGAWIAGILVDLKDSPRHVAAGAGLAMLVPALWWAWTIWRWGKQHSAVSTQHSETRI